MTYIKKITDVNGNQIFPKTHTKAVVDNNGYTAESRLQAMQDEINQAQLEVGAVASDITPTSGSSNWVTSGGVYNAIQTSQQTILSGGYTDIDIPEAQDCSVGSTYWYKASGGSQSHIAVPVSEGQTILLTRQDSESGCQIAWLSSEYNPPYVNNDALPFATGQTERIVTSSNSTELTVPSGASYLAVTKVDGAGVVYTFTLQIKGYDIAARLANTESSISELDSFVDSQWIEEALDASSGQDIDFFIHQTNLTWYSSTTYTGAFYDISKYATGKMNITKNSSGACRFAFLKDNSCSSGATPNYCTGQSLVQVTSTSTETYSVPSDCNYIYVYRNADGTDVTPTISFFISPSIILTDEIFVKSSDVDLSQLTVQDASLGTSKWYLSTTGQAHVALPVEEGEVYRVIGNESGWMGFLTSSYNPPYANNDTIPFISGTTRFRATVSTVLQIPRGCAYLVFTTVDGAGYAASYTVEKGELKRKVKSFGSDSVCKFRIAHWNVGHFALGTSYTSNITHDNYATMRQKWAEKINDINADIMMCCEYSANFVNADGSDAAISARDSVFTDDVYSNAYVGSTPSSTSYMRTAIFCNLEFSSISEVKFPNTTQSGRYYQVGTVDINGKTVKIVETHLDFNQGTTGEANRALQIQKLISDFANYEYVIIAADFNTESVSEYDSFANAGYKMANHGYMGDYLTYPAGTSPTKYLDNIICKGFTLNNIHVVNDAELSDHCCIYADFTMTP